MLPDYEKKKLEIDAEDAETLLTLTTLFNEPVDFSEPDRHPKYRITTTGLLSEYDRYFKPWVKMMYSHAIEYSFYKKEGPDGYRALREKGGLYLREYVFRNLTEDGYKTMIADFVTWAMPKAMRMAEKVSTLVDQRTFSDVMKMIQKPVEATA